MLLNTCNILGSLETKPQINSIESLVLLQSQEDRLPELYECAENLNISINARQVTFVNGIKINYTNICRAKCKICSFFKHRSNPSAYTLSIEDILQRISRAGKPKEVTLQGGLNPQLTLDFHLSLLKSIKYNFPGIIVNGYTPTEIKFIAARSIYSTRDVLTKLKEAGLDTLCGNSANILNDKVRRKITQDKLKTHDWIEIIKTAHSLHIPTSATILVGHVEDEIQIAEHMDILKRIHNETRFFTTLEIVPFMPVGTYFVNDKRIKRNNGLTRLLNVCAVARLFFGEMLKSICVQWSVAGVDWTMAALRSGVNDLGSVSVDPTDVKSPTVNGKTCLQIAMLKSTVNKMGKILVERAPHFIKKPKYQYVPEYELEPLTV